MANCGINADCSYYAMLDFFVVRGEEESILNIQTISLQAGYYNVTSF